jgi:hypothetical protein
MIGNPPASLLQMKSIVPTAAFRRWATELIRTTAVTPNVILLALLFIYRLKMIDPHVQGDAGSEYRLLTVALMLGNKCKRVRLQKTQLTKLVLDDNTYTNKTWAEVSSIKIKEIHLMEVEFLSNMRYGLYTSSKAWDDWHVKLSKFGTTIDLIMRAPPPPMPIVRMNPSPTTYHSWDNAAFSSYTTAGASVSLRLPASGPYNPEPLAASMTLKRLRESEEQLMPPKRHASMIDLSKAAHADARRHEAQIATPFAQSVPRFNLPSLTVPEPMLIHPTMKPTLPALPALNTRAMQLVYPSHLSRPHAALIPPIQTSIPSSQLLTVDQSSQLSPYGISSTASSPTSATAGAGYASAYSPSFFLAQRSSPYRPVRRVQTLLVPPPLHTYQNPPNLGPSQMQYHVVGQQAGERHVGHVPYLNYEAWPPHPHAAHAHWLRH